MQLNTQCTSSVANSSSLNMQKNHQQYKQTQRKMSVPKTGFTLIELMIALVICALVAMGAWISFSATHKANTTQTAVTEIHNDAFYIMDHLEYMVKHAGFKNYSTNLADPAPGVWSAVDAARNLHNANGMNDQLSVTFMLPDFQNSTEMMSCSNALLTGAADSLYRLELFMNNNNLMCRVVGSNNAVLQAATVIAANINRFKVFYRTSNPTDGTCSGDWRNAHDLGAANFKDVCAIHTAWLMQSTQQLNQAQNVTKKFELAPSASAEVNVNGETTVNITGTTRSAPVYRLMQRTFSLRN